MSDRAQRLIAHLLLATLLAASTFAIATAATFTFAPAFVDEFGELLATRHLSAWEQQFSDALKDLKADRALGIKALEQLLEDLSETKRGDRASPTKERAFSHVTNALAAHDEAERALSWYDEWLIHNPRNVTALVRRAALLFRIPERSDDGLAEMAALYARMPEAPIIPARYASMLLVRGARVEAWRVLLEENARRRESPSAIARRDWWAYWRDAKPFSAKQRKRLTPSIDGGGHFRASFRVPPNTVGIRFDPPTNFPLMLSDATLALARKRSDPLRVDLLSHQGLRLHEIERRNASLRTSGTDPHLSLEVAPSEASETATITARVRVAPDERLAVLLESMESLKTERELRAASADVALQELAALRLEIADLHRVGLDWRAADQSFADDRHASATLAAARASAETSFEFTAEIDARVSELRVRMPPVPGTRFVLDEVRVETATGTRIYRASQFSEASNVEKRRNVFRITGLDPWASLSLPAAVTVERAIIRGHVR